MPAPLTETTLARGVRALCRIDPDLRAVVERHGPPPLWAREAGFTTLVEIVLGQQISLAAARAAYARLAGALGEVTPERLGAVDEATLRRAGQTRQKSGYLRALGRAVADGRVDVGALAALDDDAVRAALDALRGFGPWSADIYLLMALGRPDVWPARDLALAVAMREVKRLRAVPDHGRQLKIAERWRPWRAVAARILWHHYLSTPRSRSSRPQRSPRGGTRRGAKPAAGGGHEGEDGRRASGFAASEGQINGWRRGSA